MKWLVGVSDSRIEVLREFLEREGARAFVVGDPFCDYRLAPQGRMAMLDLCKHIREAGGEVFFMSPVYATDMVLREMRAWLLHLTQERLIEGVLVHDLGMAALCRELPRKVKIIWDRFGFGRDFLINLPFLNYLKSLQINGVEVWDAGYLKWCELANLEAYFSVSRPHLLSFGRRCYTEYLSGVVCQGSLCHSTRPSIYLTDTHSGEKIIADGYTLLGDSLSIRVPRVRLSPHQSAAFIAWVWNKDELVEIMNHWK